MVQLLEQFQEEYAKILSFLFGAEMDCRHDTFQNLTKEGEEIEVGHAQFVQKFAELEGKESVFG